MQKFITSRTELKQMLRNDLPAKEKLDQTEMVKHEQIYFILI
jgi:hypothetical protein